ncbi:antibiotic biosynthesis monooxygenase [Chlorobium sp. BLA1]|uniref:putative quinol monooxygenase n=1 Tax=Candidatus Chlorobium masyuteum TaxID=2716876 RepID=UPI001421A4D2|nr:putative quinol monooxygenase [Candidatus Chlorobium masyuteum]NHQ60144.1 antibiotic biosynthesis monooxygenase [Candidatus Chlorobium masyuteum]NTU44587.1 antibiotic biosynthesis monooxygenase [Chlorobiaceae bacterium]
MSNLILVAKVVAKNESVELVKSELLKLVALAREEEGCIQYSCHEDKSDPAVFIFYEIWESQALLEKHMATEGFKAYQKAVDGHIAEKVFNKLTLLA